MSQDSDEGPGQLLFAFVRHWSRRWSGAGDTERAESGRGVLAVEAVQALAHRGEVTVNDVASQLGLDQSNASRLLTHAAHAGYLVVERSRIDRRRRTVTLTALGRQLLTAAHRWQEDAFATLTADWTSEERATFARALQRLMANSAALDDP